MTIDVLEDADAVAKRAAAWIAAEAGAAVAARGRFAIAVSGGRTPWLMLRALAREDVPWAAVHLLQVDERATSAGDADRNLTHIQDTLLAHVPIPPEQVHAMPVELPDLDAAARHYSDTMRLVAGDPPVLDAVHLGLGPDGHTASLVPGDAVLDVHDRDVAATGVYQGRRRLTLTYPALNRARRILWLVTGPDKVDALARLRRGDRSIPAGRIDQARATAIVDRAALGEPAGSLG